MSYPYEENGGGSANENIHQAQIPEAVDGACPPQIIEFRIYAQYDFNDIFGNPPASVTT